LTSARLPKSGLSSLPTAFLGGRGFWPSGGIGSFKARYIEPGATVGFHSPFFEAVARLTISQLVQTLEKNAVDPKIFARVVGWGPTSS
jgi:hypothetical protein